MRYLYSPLSLLIIFFLLLFVYTKLAGPIPFSVTSVTTQKSTTFDVTGEGKVIAKPDTAYLTAGITAKSSTVKGAQEQINANINKVSQAIKQLGVKTEDIKTTNYNIRPDYDYSGGLQKISGYSANTNISIKVRNLDDINKVIDTATLNGANQISGVNFDVEDKAKLEDEARQKAVKDAKEKAKRSSQIAGFRLGRIINYSENQPGGYRPIASAMEANDRAIGGTPTQVEPGSSEITVNVTLSYEIQ